jgi:hypothetical protein
MRLRLCAESRCVFDAMLGLTLSVLDLGLADMWQLNG